jgi:large subunit ribosomal protein L4
MELGVYNSDGKLTSKKVKLDDAVFGIEPNDHAIWLDVKRYRNAQRQGTHKSKERGEITGSTRKIKRQKGTGTARAGSIKNPLFKGGGTIFGPRPRKYDIKVNKKVSALARRSALAYKAQEEGIMLLDKISMSAPRTKDYAKMLENLKIEGSKTLFVLPENNENAVLSSRNLKGHNVKVASNINTYEIMNCDTIVFVENSHEIVQEQLKK